MSNNWNNVTPDVDDFIIADDENQNTTRSSNTNTNNNAFSSPFSAFNFVPKVDLSTAFGPFSGTNGNSSSSNPNVKIKERQYTGGDTLDEPVWETLKRDLVQIGKRLAIVVWPNSLAHLAKQQQSRFLNFAHSNGINIPESLGNVMSVQQGEAEEEENETGISGNQLINQDNLDWDLWGPLIFSLVFSIVLSFTNKTQTTEVFSGSFAFIWIFYFVIGLNVQLLGGTISFLSAISAIGYSMFPIVIGELISTLVIKWRWLRIIVMVVLNAWSIYAGVMSVKCSGVFPGRVLLAMYPVALFYSVLSWLVIIS
ncbi:Protein YIP4 [Candida viswanathii]|uniref:Protein YIP n=1 Tax=Candida viswanathii TaxID=5486 RepID=A0A367YFX4_9ASCO|nr:Protein YIP4 [Candida viswanathii]